MLLISNLRPLRKTLQLNKDSKFPILSSSNRYDPGEHKGEREREREEGSTPTIPYNQDKEDIFFFYF